MNLLVRSSGGQNIVIRPQGRPAFYPATDLRPAVVEVYWRYSTEAAAAARLVGRYLPGQQVSMPFNPVIDKDVILSTISISAAGVRSVRDLRDASELTVIFQRETAAPTVTQIGAATNTQIELEIGNYSDFAITRRIRTADDAAMTIGVNEEIDTMPPGQPLPARVTLTRPTPGTAARTVYVRVSHSSGGDYGAESAAQPFTWADSTGGGGSSGISEGFEVTANKVSNWSGTTTDIHYPTEKLVKDSLDLKAPLASPALTGTPTAPTAGASTNTTQIATTAFVAAAVALAVTGLLDFKGDIAANTNPNYPAGAKGDVYYITAAGKIGGASGKPVDVGDAVVCKADNAGGTEAAVGTSWFVLEHNLAGALLAANNLSDVASVPTARTNLGLGALAVLSAIDTAQINNGAVTYPKIQNVTATDRLIGRQSAGAGVAEEITCTAAGRALIAGADATAQRAILALGALAILNAVDTAQILNAAVTYAKIQNVSATDRLIGRQSAGAGVAEEITCTAAGRALIAGANAAAQLATLGAEAVVTSITPTAPTFQNGWGNFGSGFAPAGYWKDRGLVKLQGLVGGGSANSTIFTLPTGFRPGTRHVFVCFSDLNFSRVDVQNDGTVVVTGTPAYVDLDVVAFAAGA